MASKRKIVRRQRTWARSAGLEPDARGYLGSVDSNLFRPMSASAQAAFAQVGCSELDETAARPAKLKALHSSAALAVNFFDHWTDRDARPLLDALGLGRGSALAALRFESPYPTGLPGNPPTPDVALELDDGRIAGIESKFTEWLVPKRRGRPAFKEKYFEDGATHWANVGLARAQDLAEDLMAGSETFRYLDAPQLLKHALGLASLGPQRAQLLYLYFDADGAAGAAHRSEVARFAARADDTLGFRGISYQSLFERLRDRDDIEPDYLAYLGARYVGQRTRRYSR